MRRAALPSGPVVCLLAAATLAGARPATAQASAQSSPRPAATVVPIRLVNNHVHLYMSSAGRELSLVYDTGAGVTLLDIPVARELGFKFGEPMGIGGAGGAVRRAFALSGGQLTLPEDPTVKVSPVMAFDMMIGLYEGIPVNGILGADFTRQFVLQIDYVNERMLLHPRSFRYAGTGTRIPITFVDGKPHAVGHVVLADGARLPADCLIDVGSSGTLILTKPFVEKHRLLERVAPTIRRRSGRGVGGSVQATIGRVAAVQLGTAVLRAPVTAMHGDSAGVLSRPEFECNIGNEILRRFNVYFDYGRKEMILEPTAAISDPFETDMGGAAFRLDTAAGGIRVVDLMPRGPAETAGLREEDLVVAIDGKPALAHGIEALRRRLRRPGGEVEFRVRRPEGEQVIRLPVRRLI